MKRCFAKAVISAAFMTLCVGLGASSVAHAKKPQEVNIAISVPQLANPWFRDVATGVQQACDELGINCKVVDALNSKRKQGADVRSWITSGDYDAILATALDPYNLSQQFSLAKSFGLVTGSLAQTVPNSNLIYGMNEYAYGDAIGTQAGEWAEQVLHCKGKVLVLTQDNVASIQSRGDGVVHGLFKKCKDELQIVGRFHADDPFRGLMITGIVLGRHPDLNMVVATTDAGGLGGYVTLFANGLKDSHHAVFSGDATSDALSMMVSQNSIYRGTVDLAPTKGGYESIKILYDMVQNGVPKKPVERELPYIPVSQEQARVRLVERHQ